MIQKITNVYKIVHNIGIYIQKSTNNVQKLMKIVVQYTISKVHLYHLFNKINNVLVVVNIFNIIMIKIQFIAHHNKIVFK